MAEEGAPATSSGAAPAMSTSSASGEADSRETGSAYFGQAPVYAPAYAPYSASFGYAPTPGPPPYYQQVYPMAAWPPQTFPQYYPPTPMQSWVQPQAHPMNVPGAADIRQGANMRHAGGVPGSAPLPQQAFTSPRKDGAAAPNGLSAHSLTPENNGAQGETGSGGRGEIGSNVGHMAFTRSPQNGSHHIASQGRGYRGGYGTPGSMPGRGVHAESPRGGGYGYGIQHAAHGTPQYESVRNGGAGTPSSTSPMSGKRNPRRRGERTDRGGDRSDRGSLQSSNGGGMSSSANSTPAKPKRPGADNDELEDARRDLAKQAAEAVASADEVTLALLLTSWANTLAEAQIRGGPTMSFEHAFHASRALETVTEAVLSMSISPDSAVHKALISLFGFVLYGDETVYKAIAEYARALNEELSDEYLKSGRATEGATASSDAGSATKRQRLGVAIARVLDTLRSVALSVHAYRDLLPATDDITQSQQSASSSGPAGPDPSKVVERSMDDWRRACARLQGEMAVIVVLQDALASSSEVPVCRALDSPEDRFFTNVRDVTKKRLSEDIKQRINNLRESWWPIVATRDAKAVFDAVDSRAGLWLTQFQGSLSELEGQLDGIGLGFGSATQVSVSKAPQLLSASAAVAALVSMHQHALNWCEQTARLLTAMANAFRALANMKACSFSPPNDLLQSFLEGIRKAFVAIDGVQEWSFEPVHSRILGSLQKSSMKASVSPQPRPRSLRFEEPEKVVKPANSNSFSSETNADGFGDTNNPSQGLSVAPRKTRHARMKSSPDELLHLNAHFGMQDEDSIDGSGLECEKEKSVDQPSTSVGGEGSRADDNGDSKGEDGLEASVSDVASLVTEDNSVGSNSDRGPLPGSVIPTTMLSRLYQGGSKVREDELAVVHEGKPLQSADDEDDDDRDIVVHENVVDNAGPKKANHPSHIRSMSVDGIPF